MAPWGPRAGGVWWGACLASATWLLIARGFTEGGVKEGRKAARALPDVC